jgi:hypothetical protein
MTGVRAGVEATASPRLDYLGAKVNKRPLYPWSRGYSGNCG